jgi:hypothetical protein
MPNWKKMAEAFGRATFGRNDKENPAIKAARDSYKRDLDNYTDKDAAARAEAFFKGKEERWLDKNKDADVFEDKLSDERLAEDFDKALDEAAENHGYKKWREESKDMPANDGFGGSLHDVNREDAVQRSREEIIKALQQNTDRDVTDVLRDFGYIFEE